MTWITDMLPSNNEKNKGRGKRGQKKNRRNKNGTM